MTKALVVGEDTATKVAVRAALAEVGCAGFDAMSFDNALGYIETNGATLEILVVVVRDDDVGRLHWLTRAQRDLPVLVICEERHFDAVQLAGVTDSVVTPLRERELVGRLRWMLRDRHVTREREQRERLKSTKIVALKRENETLERLACIDPLTGLANRRHTLTMLDKEWRRSLREGFSLGLVMIDLDCFHAYNEQYGHIGGDNCLQLVCDAMGKCLHRPSDFLGRYGGEEFIAVLPSTDADGAELIATLLRAAVEQLAIPHARSECAEVVTITAGFASLRASADSSIERLVATADAALLSAKSKGRNRVEGDAPHHRIVRSTLRRSRRFTPIHADPWFVERLPMFLTEATDGARAVLEALGGAPAAIEAITKPLRTAATALALPRVERMVVDLERAALEGNADRARAAVDTLVEYLASVRVIYRRPTVPPLNVPMGKTS